MKVPLQITGHGIELTQAIDGAITRRVQKLEQFSDQLIGCRVVVEVPHRHHHKGFQYNVHIDLSLPGRELVVKREWHTDLYVAIREAFEIARRQLATVTGRRRDSAKGRTEWTTEELATA